MLSTQAKTEIIKKTRVHDTDTGSAQAQIGLLSAQIERLSEHLKKNKKDFHSRRGLLKMVATRRAHLRYLEKHDKRAFNALVKKLKI